jgi:hypothetical protein
MSLPLFWSFFERNRLMLTQFAEPPAPSIVEDTSVVSFRIDAVPQTLEEFLRQAGFTQNLDVAEFFWQDAGRSLETKTPLAGVQISFFPWEKNDVPMMRQHLAVEEQMKPGTFYEVLIGAACEPTLFRQVLRQGGVVVPKDWHGPYLVIRLEDDLVTLTEIDQVEHLELPLYYPGVYFV